jgi:hypothetical protein
MYSYSTDQSYFYGDYETRESAIENGFNDHPDLETVWVGENKKYTAHDFVSPSDIIESISEYAYEECDEVASDWLCSMMENKEKLAELNKLIGDWLEANEPVRFWTVDDIEGFDRP